MLPFLKPRQASSTIMVNDKEEKKESEASPSMLAIAEKLISHIHAKDANGVAECLSKLEQKEESEDVA